MPKKIYSSANSMVWEYFAILHRLTARLDPSDEKSYRQDVAICILLGVTAVETFFNLYFQVLVSKPPYSTHEGFISDSLAKRKSLEFKITKWPVRVFNQEIDLTRGVGKRFTELKDLRNKLTHFSEIHKELEISGTMIHNLTDTTFYKSLEDSDAWRAYHTALQFIVEVLKLASKNEHELGRLTVHWTTFTLPVILQFPEAN